MGGWVGVSVGVRGGSVLVNACQCHFLSFAYFFFMLSYRLFKTFFLLNLVKKNLNVYSV